MTARAACISLVLGLGAVLGATVPALGIWRAFAHPAIAAVAANGPADDAAPAVTLAGVQVAPSLRGEVVATLDLRPDARVRSTALTVRVVDRRGRALLERSVPIDSPSSADPSPKSVRVRLGKFVPPADGIVAVSVVAAPAGAGPSPIATLRIEVRHRLKDHTLAAIVSAGMAICGVIAATVGVAGLAIRRHPARADRPVSPLRAASCHLAGYAGYLLPFGNVLVPLALWLAWRERDTEVDAQGRAVLDFQLSILAYLLLIAPLVPAFVGLLMLPLLVLFHTGAMAVSARRAAAGREVRYPASIRFIR